MMKLKEILNYLEGNDKENLFKESSEIRDDIFGNEIYLRGIVEFSNVCKEKCLYCGLRCSNKDIKRYRLDDDDILEAVELVNKNNIGTVVLQSGNDPYYDTEFVERIINKIREKYGNDMAITLSLGERDVSELKRWKDAGADRYLLKVETFNEKLYSKMRPGRKLSERLKLIEELKKLDYEVGSGIIIDLPYTDNENIARDIIKLSELELHMIASGPFIPHNKTPLYDFKNGDLDKSLIVIALLRILNPYSNIPSTSAMATLSKDARAEGLRVGANVIMPSLTPLKVRKLYNIYPGKNETEQSVNEDVKKIKDLIEKSGFYPSDKRGDCRSVKWQKHQEAKD